MAKTIHKTSTNVFRRCISIFILVTFMSSLVVAPVRAEVLPLPGTSVMLSPGFQPPVLLGLKIHPENPLLFDFIVDQGASKLSKDELKLETEKLVKYFLAALTIPDKEVWVNLSPYEKDRIIPDVLGQTVMGKAMLEQDYMLKQLASSLTNPDEKIGQEFWSKVKDEVRNKLGNADVPMNTFNKVWIVPQKAEVFESHGIVMVGEKRLQVMMDEDYVAMDKNVQNAAVRAKDVNTISSTIFKGTILPDIEKEINEGKNFADVRQIYNSVILAAWYKQALKESLLGKVYADKGRVAGVETDDKEIKQKIYDQYIAAFKKGVYNLIREESDSATGDMIPRKYFSGGIKIAKFVASSSLKVQQVSSADLEKSLRAKSAVNTVTVRLAEDRQEAVASSTIFEQDNFITIRSGKLFAQMRQEIPELDLSEFKLQDTDVIYQLFTGIYRALADRIIADREGRSAEDIVNNRVEMSEIWFSALKSNFQWNTFNADISKRSEKILASVGLDGSKDMSPSVKKALISSVTADFIYQWQKMNEPEPEEGARASSTIFERDNLITIRSGKLFFKMRQEIPELDLSGFKLQDTDVIYQLFNGIYRSLADRLSNDSERRSTEDILISRLEMSEVWFDAIRSNYQWRNFDADVRKRSEQILASVGLDGTRTISPLVQKALVSSLTADFVSQWKKMNEPEEGARASSGVIQVDNEISIRAGKLFSLVLVPQVKELAQDGFTRQEQDAAYYLFTGIYRDLVLSILKGKKDIPDTVGNRNELRDAWFSAMGVTIAFDQLDKAGEQKVLNYLQRVGLDGSAELNPVVRDELIKSLSSDFGPGEDEREPTLTRWWNMLNPPGKEIASSSGVESDENLLQAQNLARLEAQFNADDPVAEIPGASEVLDILAGDKRIEISQRLAEIQSGLQDAEVAKYVNEETLRMIIDQIVMVYYFGTQNDRPAYFDATGLDGNPSEMKASVEISVGVLGFEKAPDDGRGHEGYTPALYGYKMPNGKWASYKQLASVLDQEGIRMPAISSSAIIEKMVNARAQSVLQAFSESAQADMSAYSELMAKKGEPVIDVAKNGIAKEFVRMVISNMLQHNFSNFESLNFQNWREISDVLHFIPEQIPSPGDFINQLTVLPADGKLDKILSEREFHEKFKALVNQAVTEIKQFKAEMQNYKKTIFDMLDSEVDSSWDTIAALKDLVVQGDFVAATSEYYQVLRDNQLIDESGMMSAPLKAALQFFILPNAEARAQGDRNFTYTASSGVSAVDRVRNLGLRRSDTFDLPTGSIIILKSLQGLPYTFVKVGERPAYKNVVPKFGLLEGDFRDTPISDLDKMIDQQLPALADNEVEFLGNPRAPELIKDGEGRTIAGINYGRLRLPSASAFGTGLLIVFADREVVLVPGAFLAVDSNDTKIKKIRAVQEDFTSKWVDLGKHSVLVKYLGLVRIGNKWQELTQFTALYNNPESRFKRLAGIAYLEGNQAKTTFLNWDQIKSQQADVGAAASSAVANELNTADAATIAQLQSQTDLERYLRGLRDFELTHDAAVMLKVPGHEKHVTLAQLMIYRNSPPGTMRSANLVRMIANVMTNVDLPAEVVTLLTVRKLNEDLALLLDAVETDEMAKVIVGSKTAELENTKRSLENIIGGTPAGSIPADTETWFLKVKKLVDILRFEISMVNEIGALTDRIRSGEAAPAVAENKIVEWLRFLPTAAPEGTSRKNISKAMAALARQAVEKDVAFIPKLQNRILVNASGRGAVIKHSKFYLELMLRLAAMRDQLARPAAASSAIQNVGGINFDPTKMNLQIKRDGQGVPLPLPQQNLEQINVQGFFPVIINIQPVNTQTLPFLLGQGDPQEKLSFLN